MDNTGEKLLRDYSSGPRSFTTQGLALLSALLGGRLRRERELDALCSRGEFASSFRGKGSGEAFAGAQTFPELFRRLDAKCSLWGSQKRYTAKELKVLINRVRTKNPQLHLPVEVIPETDGLRRQVRALAAAEAVAGGPGRS